MGESALDDIIKTEGITKQKKKKLDRTVSGSGLQRNKMLTVTCLSDLWCILIYIVTLLLEFGLSNGPLLRTCIISMRCFFFFF